jgi:lysophospholipase L1-like esterase
LAFEEGSSRISPGIWRWLAAAGRSGCVIGRSLSAAALAFGLLAAASPAFSAPVTAEDCRTGIGQDAFKADLSALKDRLSHGEPAVIVALGSSSTAGAGASSKDASYPSVLEAELRRRLPNAEIRVVNRGIGGQRARDMLVRLEDDVMSEKPDLVIWQTGANDAIHDIGVEKFKKFMRKGVARLQGTGVNVVLMDLQWLPKAERYANYRLYQTATINVAEESGAGFFRRYDAMKAWSEAGRLSQSDIIGTDGLHMVDASYYCLAVLLADGITREIGPRQAAKSRNLSSSGRQTP